MNGGNGKTISCRYPQADVTGISKVLEAWAIKCIDLTTRNLFLEYFQYSLNPNLYFEKEKM